MDICLNKENVWDLAYGPYGPGNNMGGLFVCNIYNYIHLLRLTSVFIFINDYIF